MSAKRNAAAVHEHRDGKTPTDGREFSMKSAKVKRLSRWQRLHRLLRNGKHSSMEIVHAIGTVTPSKCISELRQHGVIVRSRVARDGSGLNEYWVARS